MLRDCPTITLFHALQYNNVKQPRRISSGAFAAQADPEGYATEQYLRSPADAATTAKVQNLINGYYFSFYVSAGTNLMPYELEFYAPNGFEVRTNIGSNTGTYQVMNGYIYCTYPTNNYTVEVPYEIDATGEIVMYCAEAFSIYE